MAWNVKRSVEQARVFISYARSDGREFAYDLRTRLEAVGIPIWQDRTGMEGGRDWWLQIEEALNHVEFMVLVMTPAALQSTMVRREWRYARQQGVCVYPVQATRHLDFTQLPRWMRSVHFYDLDEQWPRFVNDLNTRCQQMHVPFMVEDLPTDFVSRPQVLKALLSTILDESLVEPTATRVALRGAGGYGKTTMAQAICHNEHIQEAFDDGILWVTLNQKPGNLLGEMEDLIFILHHERTSFTSIETAAAYFAELLGERDILLVIDDVWNEVDLKPFLQGGKRCTRLITTRLDERVLPLAGQRIQVDAMQEYEALALLSSRLDEIVRSAKDRQALNRLAKRLGKWPILLKLVNSALVERIHRGESLINALATINKILGKKGLRAFDAIEKTLRVSFELLSKEEYARFRELAIFPENADIPLTTVQILWSATGQLDDTDTEILCLKFDDLSLLLHCDLALRTIRLHDVIRTYLQSEVEAVELATFHQQFLNAYECQPWVELPQDEPYLWEHLAEHLIGAGRTAELVTTVKDGHYLATKTYIRTVYAVESDLDIAEKQVPGDSSLRFLSRSFARMSHLLNQCKTLQEVITVLHSRLSFLSELPDIGTTLEQGFPKPFLTSWHAFQDLSYLIRTLKGHEDWVRGCAITHAGDNIISASYDKTLKVWDMQTGYEQLTLVGHTSGVNGCAVSPEGDFIVSASDDGTLKIWDAKSGSERLTLFGHTAEVYSCAVSPLGDWIVSASYDKTLKIWDARTGTEHHTLRGHTAGVTSCAINTTGNWIVSTSIDQTLKLWNVLTGTCLSTLLIDDELWACAFCPDGLHLVVGGESDIYFLRIMQ